MIKLKRTPTYWWPVKVAVAQDGGTWGEETFEVQFTRLAVDALRTLTEEVKATKMSDPEYAARVVLDWRGVTDENGQALPFSREALLGLCQLPGVAWAIVGAFLDSCAKAPEKN